MKKDKDLTMLEMLLKYKDDDEKAIELLDNYPIKEIKEYYNKNVGNNYCKVIEDWSKNYNIPLTNTLSELYEKLYKFTKVFDGDTLEKEFERVKDSVIDLNVFIRTLNQNRETFLEWYKIKIENYETAMPKVRIIKEEALSRCYEYIKKGLLIKFLNGDLTLYDVKKEKEDER